MLRSLPNCVTATRGLLGPVVAWLLLAGDRPRLAFWVFVAAVSTDLFDGALAKWLGSDRRLGAFLDPLADKLLGGCTWIALLLVGWAPVWLVAPLLLRDVVVGVGWSIARGRGRTWRASRLGQVATSYEGASLGILLFHGPWRGIHWPSVGAVVGLCGLALSFASAVAYALSPPPEDPLAPAEPAARPVVSAPPVHPNLITAARLPLAPLAVVALLYGGVGGFAAAAVLALILEITDLADGWIARRYHVVSDFGKLFDPFSDASSRFTLFMGLFAIGQANLWMVLLIYYRDSTVSFVRSIAATRNVVVAARQSGKIKAVVQGVGTQIAFLSLLAQAAVPAWSATLGSVPWWTMAVITVVTLISLVDYVVGTWPILLGAWNDDKLP